MNSRVLKALVAMVLGGFLPSSAAGENISELVVFGDSLSDGGNYYHRYGLPPSPPYFDGRISNGPVWVDHLADRLGIARPTASEAGGTNYAWGSATTGSVPPGDAVLSFDQQLTEFLSTRTADSTQLFALWFGVNDLARGAQPERAAAFLVSQIRELVTHNAKQFVVLNVPDRLGQFGFGTRAQNFNQALTNETASLRNEFPDITITNFNYYNFQAALIQNAATFGFTDTRRPACRDCEFGDPPNPTDIVEDPDVHMFWDDVHPSARMHGFLGDAVWNTLLDPLGDFDRDQQLTVTDITLLQAAIRSGGDGITFEVDRNWLLDFADLQTWVHDLKQTWFGDANLDGEFNSTDLVDVLAAGEYEDDIVGNSDWSEGDWNTDGEFTSADLIVGLSRRWLRTSSETGGGCPRTRVSAACCCSA